VTSFGSPAVELTEKLHRRRDYRPNEAAAQPIKMGKIAAFWQVRRQLWPQNGRHGGHHGRDSGATINANSPINLWQSI